MAQHGNAPGLATSRRETEPEADVSLHPLLAEEVVLLGQLEETIKTGLRTFVEVGQALAKIRDLRLYRATHSTFENYCRERWAMSRPRAYQLMASAEVATSLSTTVDKERVLRPLAKLEPKERQEVWTKAKALAGDRPVTTKDVVAAAGKGKPKRHPMFKGTHYAKPNVELARSLNLLAGLCTALDGIALDQLDRDQTLENMVDLNAVLGRLRRFQTRLEAAVPKTTPHDAPGSTLAPADDVAPDPVCTSSDDSDPKASATEAWIRRIREAAL